MCGCVQAGVLNQPAQSRRKHLHRRDVTAGLRSPLALLPPISASIPEHRPFHRPPVALTGVSDLLSLFRAVVPKHHLQKELRDFLLVRILFVFEFNLSDHFRKGKGGNPSDQSNTSHAVRCSSL